jgi:hypothetical protein
VRNRCPACCPRAAASSDTEEQFDLEEAQAAAPAPVADELPDMPAGLRRAR